jgi:predicted metal-dependent HD superfamily phosphohydrolase
MGSENKFTYATSGNFCDLFWDVDMKIKEKWFDLLKGAYSQKGRFYHDLKHIDEMLRFFYLNKSDIRKIMSPEEMDYFVGWIWFHDYVQDLENDKRANELSWQSYNQFLTEIGKGKCKKSWVNNDLFRDLDYSIFSQDFERVEEYDFQIGYEASNLDNYQGYLFLTERIKFLLDTLKEGIFKTGLFRDRHLSKACINIIKLIDNRVSELKETCLLEAED